MGGIGDAGRSIKQSQNDARLRLEGVTAALNRYQGELDEAAAKVARLRREEDLLAQAFDTTARRDRLTNYSAEETRTRGMSFDQRLAERRRQQAAAAQPPQGPRNFGRGAAAGIALSNLPGSGVAQVIGGGALAGGAWGAAGAAAGAAAAGVVAFGIAATKTAIQSETLQQRLKLLSAGFNNYEQVAETAAGLARKFGLSQNEAAQAFGDTYARLRPMGASLEEIKTIFEGFNTATRLAGSSTAEAAGAYTQLIQALGSGVLRGQELNSILEQAPLLAQAIAKEMGTSVGQLKAFGEEGQISSQVVLKALARVRDEGAGRLAKALDTPAQKVKDLQNAFERFQTAMTRHIIPAVTASLSGLAGLINNISNAIDTLSAKGFAGDLNRRISYGNLKGMGGDRSGQLDDYSRVLGLLKDNPQQNRAGATAQLGAAREISKRLRGITATGNPEADARIQGLQGAAMDLIKTLEQRIQVLDKAASKPGSLASQPVPPASGSGASEAKKFEPSSKARALMAAAQKLGVSPLDLATIISFETAGTFSPSIRGGAGGNYQGLIQFGPTERQQYGVTPGQSFEEQVMGPVVRYFQDRFKGVGMTTQGADLLTLYRTVLGGNPKANINARDAFGTSAASGVGSMGPHRQKALSTFFGGDAANVGYDAADAAADLAAGWDDITQKIQESFKEGQKLSQEFTRQVQLRGAATEAERKLLQITYDHADRQAQINELVDSTQKTQLTALNNRLKELEVITAELDALYQRAELERQITDEIGKRVKDMDTGGKFRTDIDLDPNKTQGKIQEYMDQLKTELNDTEGMILSLAQTIEGELGSAMSNAIVGLVQGTQTVEQAMSQMFANVGKAFIDMATQMIAKALVMKVLGIFAGGAGGGGLFSGAGPYQFPSGGGFNGFAPGLPKLFADGGFVTGPTPAIIGEGGEPEVVLPQSKIGAALANYRPGSGAAGLAQAMNAPEGGGDGAVTVNYTGPTLNFNGDEYLPKSAVPEIIKTAAKQGASGGHARVMGDLRNKRSTRSRLGL